jgi:hypothetical protein
MMKAHGISPNGSGTSRPSYSSKDVKSEREKPTLGHNAKKRKAGDFSDDQGNQDDEESFSGSIKQDPEQNFEELRVKEESEGIHSEVEGGSREMMAFPMSMGVEDPYTSGGSFYEPSAGYHTPIAGFINTMDPSNLYNLQGPSSPFMNFSNYADHSDMESQGTPVSSGSQYQDDHIIISD